MRFKRSFFTFSSHFILYDFLMSSRPYPSLIIISEKIFFENNHFDHFSMGMVVSQMRGDSFGFPGPNCKNHGQPDSGYKYIWNVNQTERNMFGESNNQLMFWFNYMILSLPLPEDCSLRRGALDRQVAVSSFYNKF